MKSTGLFGKNSGRVGGVVFSNYRGEQVVRTYQPQVKNPNTKLQIAQRAKFKLVSQSAVPLAKEIKLSYKPNENKLTPRNGWVRKMLKKTLSDGPRAILPLEELILTNSSAEAISSVGQIRYANGFIRFSDSQFVGSNFYEAGTGVRAVLVAYDDNQIPQIVGAGDLSVVEDSESTPGTTMYLINGELNGGEFAGGQLRLLMYAYKPSAEARAMYGDINVEGDEITLESSMSLYRGNLVFSETANFQVVQNV